MTVIANMFYQDGSLVNRIFASSGAPSGKTDAIVISRVVLSTLPVGPQDDGGQPKILFNRVRLGSFCAPESALLVERGQS
jgi:hypothetical protein